VKSNSVLELLTSNAVPYRVFQFEYEPGGGTKRSSSALGVPELMVVKSLIFESDKQRPLMVLMHGDRHVDLKRLSAQAGKTKIWAPSPEIAEKYSGWPVGATNPFIIRVEMPIFVETSILELPKILINGGGRGLLVEISPRDLNRVIQFRLVRCAKVKPMVVSKAP
jgi:Cys-tRNA(Pro) deacylase